MKKLLLVCLVLGGTAFADQVNCVKWKDASGATVGTYCKPFTIKAGTNITLSDDQLTRVMTITAAGVAPGAGGSNTQVQFNSTTALSGSSDLTWNNSTSTLSVKNLEKTYYADGFSGSDFSAKVTACIAAVIAAGGGICDATPLSGAQTISSEIDVGNSSSVSVVLKLSPYLTATVSITNGTSCGIKVFDRSSLIGLGTGGSSGATIFAADNGNMDSVLCTDPTPGGGGSYVRIEGIEPGVSNTFAGTLVNGVANIQALFDDSVISRVFVRSPGVVGWYIHGVCCGTSFYNIGANGFGITGAQPMVIGKNGESTLAGFYGISPVHPGDTKNNILIQPAGAGKTTHLTFYDTYLEPNSTDTTTALIEINGVSGGVFFYGIQQGGTPAGGTTAYIVDIAASTKAVVIDGLQTGSLTNFINDNVKSRTVSGSVGNIVPRYSFGNTATYLDQLRVGASSALSGITGTGTSIVTNTSPTISTQVGIDGAAATNRSIIFNTSGTSRWIARTNTTAEGGANAGSDFEFSARDDSGALLFTPLLITRSTGVVTLAQGVKAGSSGSTISDSRELVQNAHSCGTTTTCANTANGSNRMIFGSVALSSGTPSTATITGITPFTSTSSYFCTATPVGTTATIAGNGIAVSNVSSSSFTLTGPDTVTTTVNYSCVGN